MCLEEISVVELAEAATIQVERVLYREVSHDAVAVFDPDLVQILKEEIEDLLVSVL